MTLEESKEVIPMMEAMIIQIEEQQNIMAEMLQEIQADRIGKLTTENQQWQELAQKLNSENKTENSQALRNDLRKTKELL